MKKDDWCLEITRVLEPPGYKLKYPNQTEEARWIEGVISDGENADMNDGRDGIEELLYFVLNHFGFSGSKHDPERIRIVRERQDGVLLFQGDEFHHFSAEYTQEKKDFHETRMETE